MINIRKAAGGVLAAAGLIAAAFLSAAPAQAAVVADGQGFVETKTTVDAGGVVYTISLDWNYRYTDAAGVQRVSVNPLTIKRADGQENLAADAGVDIHFDVYEDKNGDGLGAYQIEHVLLDNVNLDEGIDNQVSLNPRNPRSNPDAPDNPTDPYSYVRVTVGTDGDGLGSSPWVIFRQPAGIGFNPTV